MTSFGRFWARAVSIAVAGGFGWLTACYHYGVSLQAMALFPAAVAAPSSGATPPSPIGYRNAVAHAAASVVSVYAASQVTQGSAGPSVQTFTIGSGVVLDRAGFIVTSGRTFQGAEQVMVALEDGTPCEAVLVGLDQGSGLALLKIEAAGLKPIEIGDMTNVAVGDIVLAIGNPPGVGQTVSQGIIGAIGRKRSGIEGYIQTDATIVPGGAGGALVDTAGRLIGITSVSIAIGDESPSLRLAVPVDRMQEIVAKLKKRGRNT